MNLIQFPLKQIISFQIKVSFRLHTFYIEKEEAR